MQGSEAENILIEMPLSYFFQFEQIETDSPYTTSHSEIILFECLEAVKVNETQTNIIFSKAVLDAAYHDQSDFDLKQEVTDLFGKVSHQVFSEYSVLLQHEDYWIKDNQNQLIGFCVSNNIVNALKSLGYTIRQNTLSESIGIRCFNNVEYFERSKLLIFNQKLHVELKKLSERDLAEMQNEFVNWCIYSWSRLKGYKNSDECDSAEENMRRQKNTELKSLLQKASVNNNLNSFLTNIRLPNYGYLGWIFSAIEISKLKQGHFEEEIIHSKAYDVVNRERIFEFKSPQLAEYASKFLNKYFTYNGKTSLEIVMCTFIKEPSEIQKNIAALFLGNFRIVYRGANIADKNLAPNTIAISSSDLEKVLDCLVIYDLAGNFTKGVDIQKLPPAKVPPNLKSLCFFAVKNNLKIGFYSSSQNDVTLNTLADLPDELKDGLDIRGLSQEEIKNLLPRPFQPSNLFKTSLVVLIPPVVDVVEGSVVLST